MSHVNRLVSTLCVLLAASALTAGFGAASALGHSTDNPQWETEAGLLDAGEALSATAHTTGTQQIDAGPVTFVCQSASYLEAAEHNIKGSDAPSPGTGAETVVYGGCEVEGFSGCTINGESPGLAKIDTAALKDTLVFSSKAAAEKEEDQSLTLVEPASKQFASVSLAGSCPDSVTEVVVSGGAILAENEHNWDEFSESHDLDFSTSATQTYFRNVDGKTKAVKVKAPKVKTKKGKGKGANPADLTDFAISGGIAVAIVLPFLIFN